MDLYLEFDVENTRDESGQINGTRFDWELTTRHRLYSELYGFLDVVGSGEHNVDLAGPGLGYYWPMGAQTLKAYLFYYDLPDAKARLENGRVGIVESSLGANLQYRDKLKTKLQIRYQEYVGLTAERGVEIRQFRFETTPVYYFRGVGVGLENRYYVTDEFQAHKSRLKISPLTKYEWKKMEFTAKAEYVPFKSSDQRVFAEGWSSSPTYSLDFKMAL